MDPGTAITHWTGQLAGLAYAAAVLAGSKSRSRWLWTGGCVIFLVHVACAFQFVHHWSHAAAYAATARQTAQTTGFNSGFGLYLNYAFALLWSVDAGWWWRAPSSYLARPRLLTYTVQGFMGFMWFNATVVFGQGPVRWVFLLLFVWVGIRSLLSFNSRGKDERDAC